MRGKTDRAPISLNVMFQNQMVLTIFLIVLGIFLFDVFVLGFFASFFKKYPSYYKIKKDMLFEDDSFEYGIETDLYSTAKWTFKSVLLTNSSIYVRTTYFACDPVAIQIDDIVSFSIKSTLLLTGKAIVIKLRKGNHFFRFRTKKADIWAKYLSQFGLLREKNITFALSRRLTRKS